MDFKEFWLRLAADTQHGAPFRTLKQSKGFEAIMAPDYHKVVVIPDSTREYRHIPMREFQQMWDMMKNDTRSERYISRNGRYSRFFNPAYVCSMIDYIVENRKMQ